MKKHIVTKILGEPEQDSILIDKNVEDKFWFVWVKVKTIDEEFETAVTFDSLVDARNLKIGDEFFR